MSEPTASLLLGAIALGILIGVGCADYLRTLDRERVWEGTLRFAGGPADGVVKTVRFIDAEAFLFATRRRHRSCGATYRVSDFSYACAQRLADLELVHDADADVLDPVDHEEVSIGI